MEIHHHQQQPEVGRSAMTYDEVSMERSKSFVKALQNLGLAMAVAVQTPVVAVRQQSFSWFPDGLPRTVAFSLHQGSIVTSMDFHPTHQTLQLMGSYNGHISLWEVGVREKLVTKQIGCFSFLWCSLLMISLGQRGYKPSSEAFGADQLENDEELPTRKIDNKCNMRSLLFKGGTLVFIVVACLVSPSCHTSRIHLAGG